MSTRPLLVLSSSLSSSFWLWLLLFLSSSSHAQQAPNASLQVPLFYDFAENNDNAADDDGPTATFRHNFCDLSDQVLLWKNLTLDQALRGVALHPAVLHGDFVRFVATSSSDTTTTTNSSVLVLDPDFPGLVPRLLDEICRRAGCAWRDTYARIDYTDLHENQTFLDLLLWTTDAYDLSVEWWMRSVERLRRGVTFAEPWYDATIILVARQTASEEDDAFDPFAWLYPFDAAVWILTVATVLVSAWVYWILERLDADSDVTQQQQQPNDDGEEHRRLNMVETTWMFATAFAGQFEFDPQTPPARLFTFSIAFWALLMGAAYTANLASFLVVRNTPEQRIGSLQEAVRLNVPMCVWRSTQTDVSVSTQFPTHTRNGDVWKRRPTAKSVFEGLAGGECEIAVTEVSTFDLFQHDQSVNGDCQLQWIGRPFQALPASFAVKGDAGTFCTSLLRDVFNLHLHDMQNDGTLEELWDEHIQQTATVFCSETATEESGEDAERRRSLQEAVRRNNEKNSHDQNVNRQLKAAQNAGPEGGGDGDTTKLTLTNMGGVFLLHGVLSALSLICALFPVVRKKMCGARSFSKDSKKSDKTTDARRMMGLDDEAAGLPWNEDRTEHENGDTIHVNHNNINATGSEISITSGSDKMFFFDAHSTRSAGTHNVATTTAVEELRSEMHTKLSSIEDKLAALLSQKKEQ